MDVPSEANLLHSEVFISERILVLSRINRYLIVFPFDLLLPFQTTRKVYSLELIQQVFLSQHAMTVRIMAAIKEQTVFLQIIQEINL